MVAVVMALDRSDYCHRAHWCDNCKCGHVDGGCLLFKILLLVTFLLTQ